MATRICASVTEVGSSNQGSLPNGRGGPACGPPLSCASWNHAHRRSGEWAEQTTEVHADEAGRKFLTFFEFWFGGSGSLSTSACRPRSPCPRNRHDRHAESPHRPPRPARWMERRARVQLSGEYRFDARAIARPSLCCQSGRCASSATTRSNPDTLPHVNAYLICQQDTEPPNAIACVLHGRYQADLITML